MITMNKIRDSSQLGKMAIAGSKKKKSKEHATGGQKAMSIWLGL